MIIRYLNRQLELPERASVLKVLRHLGVLPETVVVMRNGELVARDEILYPEDDVEVIRVISGGRLP
ncbi:MAG: MoaD/ThiS family protein [Candidatus Schekmanbacteria bacterium]|nr:MoaD/ThiS family protein [Candidatus Schekmanbacteria bacterium]